MADINALIAQGVTPIQIESPINQMGKIMSIRNAQQEYSMNEQKLAEQNALRDFLKSNPNLSDADTLNRLTTGFGPSGLAYGTKLLEIDKARRAEKAAEWKLVEDKTKYFRDALSNVNTPDDARVWTAAVYSDPNLGPVFRGMGTSVEQAIAKIPTDPNGFTSWKQQAAIGATRFAELNKPHFVTQNTGGTEQVLTMPGMGGAATVVPGSVTKKTATPGELLVDARARERLAAEMEQGNYSPETVSYLATIYNQTGQLPALGIGKKAGDVKMRILEEARRLGTQAPTDGGAAPTTQEAAERVVQNKQSRAAEQSTLRSFGAGVEGRSVRSFNTAIDHLDTMSKLATALENGDVRAFNTVANAFAKGVGTAAPTNFDTAKSIVGGEVAKALAGSSMALKDREEIRDAISRANSPEQLAGSVRTLQELMGGQLKSLKLQYESGTNRKDFDSRLSSRAKEVVKSLEGGEPAATAPAAAGAASVVLPDGRTMNFPNAAAAAAFKKAAGL